MEFLKLLLCQYRASLPDSHLLTVLEAPNITREACHKRHLNTIILQVFALPTQVEQLREQNLLAPDEVGPRNDLRSEYPVIEQVVGKEDDPNTTAHRREQQTDPSRDDIEVQREI